MIGSLLAVILGTAIVAAPAPGSRPEVMLLGSYHLANNNRDLVNARIEDVLTPERQREIERMVERLARWKPTRVAVEWPRADQAGLDRSYTDYLAGRLAPSANERVQIGFRLAKRMGLTQVDAIDWSGDAPGSETAYDFSGWAKRNGQGERFDAFVGEAQADVNRLTAAMRGRTVAQWYRALNTPAERTAMHRPYFTIAQFGTDADNPGAAWVGGWYARNLRIFNNLRERLVPGERVFVLYGAGHAYLLDRFVEESGAAVLVDPLRYLPAR